MIASENFAPPAVMEAQGSVRRGLRQDTDGTVTPQDLGMGSVVSKKKRGSIAKRRDPHLRGRDPAGGRASSAVEWTG
ncbi:hypothetical protein [Streptomyces sp. NPDC055506]